MYLPAYLVLGLWLLEQVFALPDSMKQAGGVAIAAHLGGFLAGFIFALFLENRAFAFFRMGTLALLLANPED